MTGIRKSLRSLLYKTVVVLEILLRSTKEALMVAKRFLRSLGPPA